MAAVEEEPQSNSQPEVDPLEQHTFEFTSSTIKDMGEIAEITGIPMENHLGQLVEDRLRTFEWLVHHQSLGRTIVALEAPDLRLLEESSDVSGEREVLTTLIAPGKLDQARRYFDRHPIPDNPAK